MDVALIKVFLHGASTRLAGEVLRPLSGEGISAQTVSNIAKSFDKKDVERYHNRRLEDRHLYLFLDGATLKTWTGFGSNVD